MCNDKELFQQAVSYLTQAKINFWLDGGSLLGFVRDGAIIPWDTDIDFGVWHHEISEDSIMNIFSQQGFIVKSLFPQGIKSIHIRHPEIRFSRKIDISLYTHKDHRAVWMSYVTKPSLWTRFLQSSDRFLDPQSHADNQYKRLLEELFHKRLLPLVPSSIKDRCHHGFVYLMRRNELNRHQLTYDFPSHYFENLRRVRFLDVEISIPEEVEGFLALAYGQDWRTPKRWRHWWQGATYINGQKNEALC